MDHSGWLITFVVVASLALFLQSVAMVGLFLAMRRLHSFLIKIDTETRERLEKLRETVDDVVVNVREPLKTITSNIVEISTALRVRTAQIDGVVADITERSRLQIVRIDQMVTGIVERAEHTAATVEQNVVAPVQEFAAVVKGVRRGLEFLFTRRRTASATEAVQDEQMFI
jgi:methyl-accepting chemotaxis protein